MLKFIVHLLLTLLSLPSICAQSQDSIIRLRNPSFEDEPQISNPPNFWQSCGAPGESPPDVQPGSWLVDRPAYDGATYLGLVVRDNTTNESVAQKLPMPLKPGNCYSFSIYMCRSQQYISRSHRQKRDVNYVGPVQLRIWGGRDTCDQHELLGISTIVESPRWQKYEFIFEPNVRFDYLMLEASPSPDAKEPVNGHLLLDFASDLVVVECTEN